MAELEGRWVTINGAKVFVSSKGDVIFGLNKSKDDKSVTADEVWDKEYPKVQSLYDEGVKAMKEGRRLDAKETVDYGKDKIREGVGLLKQLQKRTDEKTSKELGEIIANWNDEINVRYKRGW